MARSPSTDRLAISPTNPPGHEAPPVERDTSWSDQVIRRSEAVQRLGAVHVRRMVRRGLWVQPNPHVVVQHNGPMTHRQRLWVAVLSSPTGSVIAGMTALREQGFRGQDATAIHVLTVERARRVDLPGVVVHCTYALPEDHLDLKASPQRTTIARSVVDAAAWADSDRLARGIVLGAVRQRLVGPQELLAALDARLRQRRGRTRW
jgi:hypothetical protein